MTASLAGIVILADDLSGAAETAACLTPGAPDGVDVRLLGRGRAELGPVHGPVALDLDSRALPAAAAARAVTAVAAEIPPGRLLVKKVDSLLRGNWAAELSAIARTGRTVVFAPALPRLNRVLRDGRPLVDGGPLADTAAWRLEPTAAPTSLSSVMPDAQRVPLDSVRDESALRGVLQRARPGTVLVCDAETEGDLDRIAGAVLESGRDDLAAAGSSALAAAAARGLGASAASELPAGAVAVDGPAAFIVGTAEPSARAQVAALRDSGARVVAIHPLSLLAGGPAGDSVAQVRTALRAPVSVVTVRQDAVVGASSAPELSRRFAEVVAAALAGSTPGLLTLTGGETARAVLDALAVRRLTVRGTVNGGAALSIADSGTTVVTRPGSFGTDDDFLRILERVAPSCFSTLRTTERPS
jgi:uncharacterized protein YgbK (DUF1537 family)